MLFFVFYLNCYFHAFMDCVRPSTATPQTVTNLASFHVVYQLPELLQTSPQEEEELCQTSPWPWRGGEGSVCRCSVHFRGDDLTANNP